MVVDASEVTDPKVTEVLESCSTIIPASSDLKDANETFLKKHKASPAHVFSAVRTRALLDSSSKSQNEKDLAAILGSPNVSLEDTDEALALFKEWKSADAVVSAFKKELAQKFPDASSPV